jgi:hypothetical protein
MNQRFILFRRGGVFYCEDTTTRKQLSLRTKDEGEAKTLLNAKNESFRQPILNLQIARTYMAASDPQASKSTWQSPMPGTLSQIMQAVKAQGLEGIIAKRLESKYYPDRRSDDWLKLLLKPSQHFVIGRSEHSLVRRASR